MELKNQKIVNQPNLEVPLWGNQSGLEGGNSEGEDKEQEQMDITRQI